MARPEWRIILLSVTVITAVVLCLDFHLEVTSRDRKPTQKLAGSVKLPVGRSVSKPNWEPPTLPSELQGADQHDPRLISQIRANWIIKPSTGATESYADHLGKRGDFSEHGQPTLIDRLLGNRTHGFLVECGAADGLKNSNSLFFELYRDWSGILIEANPKMFSDLLQRNRHMYKLNACLSPTTKAMKVNFTLAGIGGGISDLISAEQKKSVVHRSNQHEVQCFPLYSVLAALDISHVDYFSLDIEGPEIQVLKTIPFQDLQIDSFTIEKRVVLDTQATEAKARDIEHIMVQENFKFVQFLGLDTVFLRTDLA